MDDKAYTCFYCHSILPYEVCISGSHFCLQGSNAIEFWGNVVKMASTKNPDDEEGEEEEIVDKDAGSEQRCNKNKNSDEISVEESETVVFPDIETIVSMDVKTEDDTITAQTISESKPMSWKIKLINLIKERPPLYDKRLPHYERTFPIRAKLWKEVYEGLDGQIPLDAIPKKFKVFRDRYNREMKRMKLGCNHEKPWNLLKYLTFLSCKRQQVHVTMKPTNENTTEIQVSERTDPIADEESFPDFRATFELKKKFVTLVGQRPPLYDTRLPQRERLTDVKVKLWKEVYDGLNGAIPLVELPNKFKTIKGRYFREKKKKLSNWALLPYLAYLKDVPYFRLNGPSNEKTKKVDLSALTPTCELREPSPVRNDIAVESNFPPSLEEDTSQSSNKRKKYTEESFDCEQLETSSSKENKLIDVHENWDEDDFFGAYLVRLMKKIPIENKLNLHMEIMKMIQHFSKS